MAQDSKQDLIPEKKRYLHLNGDHVESPYWKKFFLNSAFLGATVGSAVSITLAPSEMRGDLFDRSIAVNILTAAFFRASKAAFYTKPILNAFGCKNLASDNVIDMKPEQSATAQQRKAAYEYLGMSATLGLGWTVSPLPVLYLATQGPNFAGYMALNVFMPFFIEGGSVIHRSIMVARGKWNLIDKNQMTLQNVQQPLAIAISQPS